MYVLSHLWRTVDFVADSYTWPLLCYLLVCCAFPLTSAAAHLFNVMSDRARHVCFFLDYSALSLFSFGVAIIYRAYCFPSDLLSDGHFTWYRNNYVNVAAVFAILCTLISCETRFMMPSTLRKALRLGSFAVPYVYDSIPLVYRLIHKGSGESHVSAAQYLHTRQFLFAFLAAFLYASHLPERLLPGIFDIVGHSHQLFHVFSILAVVDQLQAVLLDFRERREYVQHRWHFEQPSHSLAYLAAILLINLFVIFLFTLRLLHLKHKLKTS